MSLVPRRLRDLARRKTGAEADAESAEGLDEREWNLPIGGVIMGELIWDEKRVLTEEEIAKFREDFIAAVEGRWPSATLAPETSVTPRNTKEGEE